MFFEIFASKNNTTFLEGYNYKTKLGVASNSKFFNHSQIENECVVFWEFTHILIDKYKLNIYNILNLSEIPTSSIKRGVKLWTQ